MTGDNMVGFIIGFILGFSAHYAIFCADDLKEKCVKCYDFMLLKKKIVKANKKKKGKK
tara:strand:- start:489 stop:662 length:174 start_codon:yes stop_codon:yes gene_type:complete